MLQSAVHIPSGGRLQMGVGRKERDTTRPLGRFLFISTGWAPIGQRHRSADTILDLIHPSGQWQPRLVRVDHHLRMHKYCPPPRCCCLTSTSNFSCTSTRFWCSAKPPNSRGLADLFMMSLSMYFSKAQSRCTETESLPSAGSCIQAVSAATSLTTN